MYKIFGVHQGNKEQLDSADNLREAKYLVKEYRLAFGIGWIIYYK